MGDTQNDALLDVAGARALLLALSRDLVAQKDRLTELDAAIGDGDMGVTISMGFTAVEETLRDLEAGDVGTLFMRAGMTLANTVPSTIGTLLATGFMAAGKEAKGMVQVGLDDGARMMRAACAGMQARGKANLGDKTILDALLPACDALGAAATQGATPAEALAAAVAAADAGVQATVPMQSRVGRAGWLAERTIGHADAGATLCYLILRSVQGHIAAA